MCLVSRSEGARTTRIFRATRFAEERFSEVSEILLLGLLKTFFWSRYSGGTISVSDNKKS